ncbi:MAG TPA: phosphatase PAP2 family protein [Flavobacteriales bacterium]
MRQKALLWFVVCTATLMVPGLWAVFTHGHTELHLAVNRFHGPYGDLFFAPFTHLGDGLTVLAVSLLFLLRSWRGFLMVGLSAGLSALVTQTLKRTLFAEVDRPMEFLAELPELHLVQGVVMNHHNSFPSGHSTAAFSMCCALAVLIARPTWSIALALLAGLLAYSRVYLSQHFTEDVLAGAFIGTLTASLVYVLLFEGPWSRNAALDRSLLRGRP